MEQSDNKTIFLNSDDYDKSLQEIDALKQQLINLQRQKSAIYKQSGGRPSAAFVDLTDKIIFLDSEIKRRQIELEQATVAEESIDEEIVNLSDILNIDIIFAHDDVESDQIKLVGSYVNSDAEIEEVSINSPIGRAIYQKKIGEIVSYQVEGKTIQVYIKEKVDLLEKASCNNKVKQITL